MRQRQKHSFKANDVEIKDISICLPFTKLCPDEQFF